MDHEARKTMFELAAPQVLMLWPLPLLIRFLLPRMNLQLPVALKVPFFNAMTFIVGQKKNSLTREPKLIVLLVIWSLLLLALAGPRHVGKPRSLNRDGHNIMMVLDLSPSMAVNDMFWQNRHATRLDVVKHAAEQFVQNRTDDKIGLIVFGERAYLQTPLTHDHHNVLQRLDDVTAGLAGKSTSIGDALGLAVKHLQNVPDKGRVIILLTDGANNSGVLAPLKAAELARDDGLKVYTIGLGSQGDTQTFNGLFLSMNASAELDEKTLINIAKMTGARYFRATNMKSLQAVYQAINQMETVSQDQTSVRPRHDYYPWPLALAWLLLMYLFAPKLAQGAVK
jgi:Ca-activated chloride channel family protein